MSVNNVSKFKKFFLNKFFWIGVMLTLVIGALYGVHVNKVTQDRLQAEKIEKEKLKREKEIREEKREKERKIDKLTDLINNSTSQDSNHSKYTKTGFFGLVGTTKYVDTYANYDFKYSKKDKMLCSGYTFSKYIDDVLIEKSRIEYKVNILDLNMNYYNSYSSSYFVAFECIKNKGSCITRINSDNDVHKMKDFAFASDNHDEVIKIAEYIKKLIKLYEGVSESNSNSNKEIRDVNETSKSTVCSKCEGGGFCWSCGRTGETDCNWCGGDGYIRDGSLNESVGLKPYKCGECGGDGRADCPICHGKGICMSCHGKGYY